jgi:hypothetical protein
LAPGAWFCAKCGGRVEQAPPADALDELAAVVRNPAPNYAQPRPRPVLVQQASVVTIQKTSKRLKLNVILSALVTIAGAVLSLVGMARHIPALVVIGVLAIVFGLIWEIITKFQIWWNHG